MNEHEKQARLADIMASSFQSLLEANMKRMECQIDSRFKDLESHLLTSIEKLKESVLISDQNILSIEKSITMRQNELEATIKQKIEKPLHIPTRLVPGFVTSKLTWRYQSCLGNFLTANGYYDVSVDQSSAFQEWTAILIDNSQVILRNEHGSFLCAHPNGKVNLQHKPDAWEKWTVINFSDGTIALLRQARYWYLCHEGYGMASLAPQTLTI
jgi:hypothetical protein